MSTDIYTNSFSDNFRLAKSRYILSPSDATYNVIRLPKYAFVSDVWIMVVVGANVEPTAASVGWSGNGETAVAAGFMSTELVDPTNTGLKRAQKSTTVNFPGKYFNGGSGAVTFTYAAGTATTLGGYFIFVQYSVVH
jgi:hypothetical protein